jgi:hypothetical protein
MDLIGSPFGDVGIFPRAEKTLLEFEFAFADDEDGDDGMGTVEPLLLFQP